MKMVGRLVSWIPDILVLAVACLAQAAVVLTLLRDKDGRYKEGEVRRFALVTALVISWALMMFGFALRSGRVSAIFHGNWAIWLRATVLFWTLLSTFWAVGYAAIRALSRWRASRSGFDTSRRGFMETASTALLAAPVAALGYGIFIERHQIGLREHDIGFRPCRRIWTDCGWCKSRTST